MSEKPILFSGAMVRAILAGRKTQTRRTHKKARYAVGDILWVRETWKPTIGITTYIRYRADDSRREVEHSLSGSATDRWRPSIFMPKWAARIWLRVLKVRCERLQEISLHDVYAEGFPHLTCESFRVYWDSLNAKRDYGWDSNPWVWVYEFKRNE